MQIFLLWDVCAHTRTRVPPVAAEGDIPKRCAGRREYARGAVCYTSQLRIGAWNCGGLSNVIMMCASLGFNILALSETHSGDLTLTHV